MEEKTKALLAALEALPCGTFEEQDEVVVAAARALKRYVAARCGDEEEALALFAREMMS